MQCGRPATSAKRNLIGALVLILIRGYGPYCATDNQYVTHIRDCTECSSLVVECLDHLEVLELNVDELRALFL